MDFRVQAHGALFAFTLAVAGLADCGANALAADAPVFEFAPAQEARTVIGAHDDFVRGTTALERRVRMKTRQPVDEDRFARYLQSQVLEWRDDERKRIEPLLAGFPQFLARLKWQRPDRILLIVVDPEMEGGSPHTRANAIVLPRSFVAGSPRQLRLVLAHEVFHVLSRYNRELREALYASVGFKRCARVELPAAVEALRVTNPDAVENRHTLSVRLRGEARDALPYVAFPSADVDVDANLLANLDTSWLLVDRAGGDCRARVRSGTAERVAPSQLQGVYEQIGRNSDYLIHPEELLADNFMLLMLSALGAGPPRVPSPEIIERMRAILFD